MGFFYWFVMFGFDIWLGLMLAWLLGLAYWLSIGNKGVGFNILEYYLRWIVPCRILIFIQ